jgi:hypothetical protein
MALAEHRPQDIGSVHLPMKGLAKWSVLRPILKEVLGKMGIKISTDGKVIQNIDGGLHLGVGKGSTAGASYNFQIIPSGSGVTVANGQFGTFTPTIGGVPLDASTPPTLSVGSDCVVYLQINTTPTVVLGFVTAMTVSSVTVETASSIPSTNHTTHFYKLLGTITGGAVVDPQPVRTSLSYEFCDRGTADGKADMTTFAS